MFRDAIVADAGVSIGDEITWFNGVEVRSANQLATLIGVLPAFTWVSLGYRPSQGDEFGDERRITVRMAVLDTGSSKDGYGEDARMASRIDRRMAARSLLARFSLQDDGDARQWDLVDGDGVATLAKSDGRRLRLDIGDLTLVRTASGEGFAVSDGKNRALSVEEAARLDRELRCNPFLWPTSRVLDRLAESELIGGVHVSPFGIEAVAKELGYEYRSVVDILGTA
mgnify:CR=1 FL=1